MWWQQLRSPHLIEIISAARNDAGLTLVLDQAACVVIGSVPLLAEPSQALFMCQALEALRVVHEAGHAHGGVGPEALLLDSQGRARLGLPGLSKTTSVYRAPELKRRQRTASGDIYSAGKVLERLAGHGPHRWADIIARATAGLPTDRFQSVLAMREAIEAAMAEDGHDWVAPRSAVWWPRPPRRSSPAPELLLRRLPSGRPLPPARSPSRVLLTAACPVLSLLRPLRSLSLRCPQLRSLPHATTAQTRRPP